MLKAEKHASSVSSRRADAAKWREQEICRGNLWRIQGPGPFLERYTRADPEFQGPPLETSLADPGLKGSHPSRISEGAPMGFGALRRGACATLCCVPNSKWTDLFCLTLTQDSLNSQEGKSDLDVEGAKGASNASPCF